MSISASAAAAAGSADIWAPVVAALGASLLTIMGSFGLTHHRQKLRERAAREEGRSAAYRDLHGRSLDIMMRVRAVGEVMRLRSSRGEPRDIPLRGAEPVDLFKILEWIVPAFQPFSDAWSRVCAVGSQPGIDAGRSLVLAVYNLMSTAVSPASERGWLLEFLDGKPWTDLQRKTYEEAIDSINKERAELINVMRRESGARPAQLEDPHFHPPPGSQSTPSADTEVSPRS
jgi:hypothetical protein